MKKICLLFVIILILSLTACNNIPENEPLNNIDVKNDEINLDNVFQELENPMVNATYTDSVHCFEDLTTKASLIVRVTVDNISNPSPISQRSFVTVKEIYAGEASESFYVCQLLDCPALEKGAEYILFLNPQSNGYEGNEYYCVGGIGAIRLNYNSKQLTPSSKLFMDQQLEEWLARNTEFADWSIGSLS